MSSGGSGGNPSGLGTGYTPDGTDAAGGASGGQDEAVRRLLESLDQIGREVEIAAMTLDGCNDLEATAYHLRRALAHMRFAGGVLVDLRKRAGSEPAPGQGASGARTS